MSEIDELTLAIWDNDIRAVKRLLKQRPERAREANERGVTPLMRAALSENRSVRVMQALLDAGADAKAATNDNSTVLHWTVGKMGDYRPGEPFIRLVKMLAEAGAPLEERQMWGWTPLMSAIMEGRPYEVGPLLEIGCNPNVFFPMHSMPLFTRGRSALSQAIAEPQSIKLLLVYGADAHALDLNGQTALEVALQVLEESKASTASFSEEILRLLPKPPEEMHADFLRKVMQSIRVLKKAVVST